MIAVDPGVKGGMAYDVGSGPILTSWGGVAKMYEELETVLTVMKTPPNTAPVAYVEHVTASPIMGRKAAFTFGHNFGQLETLFFALNVRVELIKPQVWQRGIPGLGGSTRKRALKAHATRLYPDLKVTAATQDALLILDYAKRTYDG